MAAQSLFLVHEVRYSRPQLRRIYKRYAASMGWNTHGIMIDLYIDAWQQKRVGPVGDAIAAHESSADRHDVRRPWRVALAVMIAAVGAATLYFWMWH